MASRGAWFLWDLRAFAILREISVAPQVKARFARLHVQGDSPSSTRGVALLGPAIPVRPRKVCISHHAAPTCRAKRLERRPPASGGKKQRSGGALLLAICVPLILLIRPAAGLVLPSGLSSLRACPAFGLVRRSGSAALHAAD